jgi:Ca2+-binding EF-hand superfamily protein
MGCGASSAAPSSGEAKPTSKAILAEFKDDSEDGKRYGAIIAGHEAAIKSLFKKIDADGDGGLINSELKDIVSKYTGDDFDEAQFFGWFDVHGANGKEPDARLDLKEFAWYIADVAEGFEDPQKSISGVIKKFEEILAGPEATRYGFIVEGHEAAIQALFKKIDADGDGHLVTSELKDVVSKYTGEAFDEAQFFGWFDVHGANGKEPDARLDLTEFGWYLADIAESFTSGSPKEVMAQIIKDFDEKCG